MKTSVLSTTLPTITPELGTINGRLTYCKIDTTELIKKHGSPLYVMSENRIRQNCVEHKRLLNKYFGKSSIAAYASKAMSCRQIYRILNEEDMHADVVSIGELYTAVTAGFDPQRLIFHGNNKTPSDIAFAIERNIGLFAADNMTELAEINRVASEHGIRQRVIIRVTPGIDPHTHAKINTARIDSKFGSPISNGQAEDILRYALSLPSINVEGFHYHIGSQITDVTPFCDALDIVLDFMLSMRKRLGFTARVLNIGGGFGIRYLEHSPKTPYDDIFSALSECLNCFCVQNDYARPTIITEPGRSIVADAGITLYTVGAVKNIPGYKTYVSVDGGMTDNPRFTLYNAPYTAVVANKADKMPETNYCIAGRCCESGDIIIPDSLLPNVEAGDIIAVLNTGAYNYSMASNYNRIPRPAVVMIDKGADYVAVKRESLEHLSSLDN